MLCYTQLHHLWWMPNSVSKGWGPAKPTGFVKIIPTRTSKPTRESQVRFLLLWIVINYDEPQSLVKQTWLETYLTHKYLWNHLAVLMAGPKFMLMTFGIQQRLGELCIAMLHSSVLEWCSAFWKCHHCDPRCLRLRVVAQPWWVPRRQPP